MTNWAEALGLSVTLAWGTSISSVLAQQLNPQQQQIEIIKDAAASICNTVKEAKGQKSDIQIEGDIKAQLGGLVGKLADIGGAGKGSVSREQFEGLSRDATAAALEGDRGCRERVFDKMLDKWFNPGSMDQREQKAQENLQRSSTEELTRAHAQCPAFITQAKLKLDAFLHQPIDPLSGMINVPSFFDLGSPVDTAMRAISMNLNHQQSDVDAFMKAFGEAASLQGRLHALAVHYGVAIQQLDRLNAQSDRVPGTSLKNAQEDVARKREAIRRDGDDLIGRLQSMCEFNPASMDQREQKKAQETSH
jgi:hypothetical protein